MRNGEGGPREEYFSVVPTGLLLSKVISFTHIPDHKAALKCLQKEPTAQPLATVAKYRPFCAMGEPFVVNYYFASCLDIAYCDDEY